MKRLRRLAPIIGLLVALLLVVLPVMPALAATTGIVTINATPSFISISINTVVFDFSTVTAGVDEDTTTGYFGITNGSTVITSTTIVSNDWQSGGTKWTWGAPAADTAQMKASDGDGAYDVTIDEVTPVALASATAATTDWVFELQIDAASSYTHGDAQGTTITLSCTAD